MALPTNFVDEMIEVGRLLYDRGLIAGTEGNISVRLDEQRILITPSGLPKGRLTADDLVVVDSEGRQLEGRKAASSELPMHLKVYKKRSEVNACVHSHAPYATSFAVAGVELTGNILPEVVLFVGSISLTDYAPPGTDAVGDSLEPFIGESTAFLLRNHGLLTIGRDLREAFYRHETVEQYARIIHHARQLGNIDSIPPEDVARLERIRRRMGPDPAGQQRDL
ncbi:MAG: class II aldolase/adducin family protein [Candidatus Zixiibacteriota bacterium]|nr:MAG: class II aldolase/adducin family protein [candidate division Zixibacteria bacterium]